MRHTAFAIATDGSNDTDTKLYPVVVRYYNSDLGEVVCHPLALPNLVGNSTGENIAGLGLWKGLVFHGRTVFLSAMTCSCYDWSKQRSYKIFEGLSARNYYSGMPLSPHTFRC